MPDLTLHVCAHFAREASAALRARGHSTVRVVPFTPTCDPAPVAAERLSLRDDELVLGGACVRDVAPDAAPSRAVAKETCFHLLADRQQVDSLLASGAFLVTPGWLDRWRTWIDRAGLDRTRAQLLFSESARSIVLLDTGVGDDSVAALEAFAEYVGLPSERMAIGLERFGLEVECAILRTAGECADRRAADHAMILDVLASAAPTSGETAVVDTVVNLAMTICGAQRAAFWPSTTPRARPAPPHVVPPGATAAETPDDEAVAAHQRGDGFVIRVGPAGNESGWLGVAGVEASGRLHDYVNAVEMIAVAGHLAIQNARMLRGLLPICFNCKRIKDDAGAWNTIEEYVSARSDATFSHALCPECLDRLYPAD